MEPQGDSGGGVQDKNADGNMDSKGYPEAVSDVNEDSISNSIKGYPRTMVKNLNAFYTHPEMSYKLKFSMSNQFICWKKFKGNSEATTQILVTAFRQIYSENQQQVKDQNKSKNMQFGQNRCKIPVEESTDG